MIADPPFAGMFQVKLSTPALVDDALTPVTLSGTVAESGESVAVDDGPFPTALDGVIVNV